MNLKKSEELINELKQICVDFSKSVDKKNKGVFKVSYCITPEDAERESNMIKYMREDPNNIIRQEGDELGTEYLTHVNSFIELLIYIISNKVEEKDNSPVNILEVGAGNASLKTFITYLFENNPIFTYCIKWVTTDLLHGPAHTQMCGTQAIRRYRGYNVVLFVSPSPPRKDNTDYEYEEWCSNVLEYIEPGVGVICIGEIGYSDGDMVMRDMLDDKKLFTQLFKTVYRHMNYTNEFFDSMRDNVPSFNMFTNSQIKRLLNSGPNPAPMEKTVEYLKKN